MHASVIRRQLSGLVPPKIASPTILVSPPLNEQPSLSQFPVFFILLISSLRGRVRTSAPSSHSTPSSQRALRPNLPFEASRRATLTARTLPPRPSSSPFWRFSDLGTPSTTRASGASSSHCFYLLMPFFSSFSALEYVF